MGQQCEQFVHMLRGREQGVDSAQAGRSALSLFWAVFYLAARELPDPSGPSDRKFGIIVLISWG